MRMTCSAAPAPAPAHVAPEGALRGGEFPSPAARALLRLR